MTYIIERPETMRVDYVQLVILFYDRETGEELHSINVCEIKAANAPELRQIVDSEYKVVEFRRFCTRKREEIAEHGYEFLSYEWERIFHTCSEALRKWQRLLHIGAVTTKWEIKETQRTQEVPRRSYR